ncbi:hypothetical protein [Nocardioides sp. YIM 152315]|uniref:hypothetical protein n=1 Tax=Nocardioides sp. YIM 152315 TaxID=3031760 RepID=UPI0023D99A87|nr:hypothetical protein [Nocardioides sp. YIM 152315]MDF1604262.1 hypothetical protein [Nocardioides sp. YIM 152315]
MWVRWIGLALALVLAVAAALLGYRLGEEGRPTPTTFAAEPLPAVSPSYPVTPARVVRDDPYPPLAPGAAVRPVRLGTAPFQVSVPAPRGWVRSVPTAGEWRWYPSADKTKNVYFLRVRQVGAQYQSVSAAVADRIAALDNADDVDDFVVEDRQRDRFVSHYVADEHRRVSYEGYLPRGGDVAYLWVAVIGREADRDGLQDLFTRVMAGARTDLS